MAAIVQECAPDEEPASDQHMVLLRRVVTRVAARGSHTQRVETAAMVANSAQFLRKSTAAPTTATTRPLPLPLLPARAGQWKKWRVETAVSSTGSLRDAEAALRDKWLLRLRAVHHRAGTAASAATLLDNVDSQFELAELAMLSLGKGAWSTLRGHVRRWEAFERWAQPVCVYPPTVETILRYYGHKDANSCGSCVLPAFRGTLAVSA